MVDSVNTVVAVPTGAKSDGKTAIDEAEVARGAATRRRWKLVAAVIIGAIMIYLLYKSTKKKKNGRKENQAGSASDGGPLSRLLGGILDFDRSRDSELTRDSGPGASAGGAVPRLRGGAQDMPDPGAARETEEALLELANSLANAGFLLAGVSSCKWTQVQREMFGKRGSPARNALERIYIECRGNNGACAGLKGHPTWVRGGRQFGGFQPPARLRAMVREMSLVQPRQMLASAPEPLEVNLPDEKHIAPIPEAFTQEQAKKTMYQMLHDMKANQSSDVVAAVESNRSGAGVSLREGGSGPMGAGTTTAAAVDNADETDTDAAGGGEGGGGGSSSGTGGPKKEFARGVSAYANCETAWWASRS